MDKIKERGEVYTPIVVVTQMLNMIGYTFRENIQDKHIIDNSCGDGRFLTQIVKRYIQQCKDFLTKEQLANNLSTHIHGIELDKEAYNKCVSNLNEIVKKHNIPEVKWDILNENALNVTCYDGKMDFVVGNPPYVRVHNIKGEYYDNLRNFSFTEKGNSDLYLAFYELGLRMRNSTGHLAYITPSAWCTNASGKNFRKFIKESRQLQTVYDYQSSKVFGDAATYVMICHFTPNPNIAVLYSTEPLSSHLLSYDEIFVDDKLFFCKPQGIKLLKDCYDVKQKKCVVKNGYATLCDKVFIDNVQDYLNDCVIPVIKSSTGEKKMCVYPYDENGKIFQLQYLEENYNYTYLYLMMNEGKLRARDYDTKYTDKDQWWAFGRKQAINDTYKRKIAINSLIRDENDLKIVEAKEGTGVYGGLYILTDENIGTITSILKTREFSDYVKLFRHYKSGGYFAFTAKEVEKYLNYCLSGNNSLSLKYGK